MLLYFIKSILNIAPQQKLFTFSMSNRAHVTHLQYDKALCLNEWLLLCFFTSSLHLELIKSNSTPFCDVSCSAFATDVDLFFFLPQDLIML